MRHLLVGVLLACTVAPVFAQGCAATPEAAARAAVGLSDPASGGNGFRVADVQVDTAMKRVWLRVVRCEDASAPAMLVPLSAPLRSGAPVVSASAVASAPAARAAAPVAPATVSAVVIHAGDAVQATFATSSTHMTLDAVANQQGSVGDVISLTLKRRVGQASDEPDHRIRGMVRADKTVEVQP